MTDMRGGPAAWARAAAWCAAVVAPSAEAQDPVVDDAAVEACFEGAAVGVTEPPCLGAAAGACQTRPGGASTIGIVECIVAETAAWDAILNREYRATREALTGTGAAGIDVGSALLDAQRAWIAFRDAECALSYARWQDGTLRSVVGANCVLVMTAVRALELRDMRGEG